LEDHANPPLLRRQIDVLGGIEDPSAVERDASILGGLVAGYAPEDGRFAAPAWAEQNEQLAVIDSQVNAIDGAHGVSLGGEGFL
jgi:hypothetical protein